MAMMIALLAMQLISRVLGPDLFLTGYLKFSVMRWTIDFTGGIMRFLWGGSPPLRFTMAIVIVFLVAGAWLGKWVNQEADQSSQRVLQAAALLFFTTFTVVYLLDFGVLEFHLQEILLTLAISFLVYAIVLSRLISPMVSETWWRAAAAVSVISLAVIIFDTGVF